MDWSRPDAAEQANALARAGVLELVQAYRQYKSVEQEIAGNEELIKGAVVGIVAGTYSTVFIASSIAIILSQRKGRGAPVGTRIQTCAHARLYLAGSGAAAIRAPVLG